MNEKKVFLTIIAFTLLFSTVFGQREIKVQIPSRQLNNVYQQQRGNWCWAASISTLLKYYGYDISQEKVVQTAFRLDSYENLPDIGVTAETINYCLNGLGIDSNGKRFRIQSKEWIGIPSSWRLIKELRAKHPVLVAYKNCPSSGHAVLLTGCTYRDTPKGPVITSLTVSDPIPQHSFSGFGGQEGKKIIRRPRDFVKAVHVSWYVRVMPQ